MPDHAKLTDRPFHGVWSASLTPLNRTYSPDHGAFADHCRFQLENGCHGVAPFGTTGEANSFSVSERTAGLEALVKAGVPPEAMIPGTGCCAGPDTVTLTRHAVSLGCKGVLMLPPFYYKNPSEEGLYRAFSTVIDQVSDERLRVLLYHIPPMSQIPIPHGLIRRLSDAFPGVIAGLKDSSGDWASIEGFVRAFPDLAIFPGSELFMLDALRIGGAGCISATCNINAKAIRRVFDAFLAGDHSADQLQEKVSAARRAMQDYPVVPAMRRLIAERRKSPQWAQPRAPFLPLDEGSWKTLSVLAETHGFEV